MQWLEDVKQQADKDIVVMLVGNKVDLAEGNPHDRQVDFELARAYAEKNGLFFSEASALTTYNVKKVFEHLMQGKAIRLRFHTPPQRSTTNNVLILRPRPMCTDQVRCRAL